ncbi:MAG: hypothetical protein QOC55_1086 [Thermoleophilaceae bacterium]|nr:hypothetical protein [Thermoleophilaceae bacterium]
MKTLCAVLVAAVASALLAIAAAADTNDLTFNQGLGADGQDRIDITVSYVFPGVPPRTGNFGAGTVRVTLPGASLKLDPTQPVDPAYACFASGDTATCSAEGQPNGGGLTFPTAIAIHLISARCWSADPSSPAAADVWAAPTDPGTAPDASLPISDGGTCGSDSPLQPVLTEKSLKCTVPKLNNVSVVSATRRLANAKCARGSVKYARSKSVKKGHVISQSVKPGKVLKEKAKVNLVVSRGSG